VASAEGFLPPMLPKEYAHSSVEGFLPPVLPKEYAHSFHEEYKATSLTSGRVLNHQVLAGTQYWSLGALSTRGMVSSGPGLDKGTVNAVISQLTVTNYSDPSARASLVVDLVNHTCDYYAVEGAASYPGYDYYRRFIAGATAAGIGVVQYNASNWVHDGQRYGPVNIWAATPPTGVPGRVLTYTIVFLQDTNHLLSYQTNGTEHLPNSGGGMEPVTMRQVSLRTDYTLVPSYPAQFFSTVDQCFFSSRVHAGQGAHL
jgi:hypothetical protein